MNKLFLQFVFAASVLGLFASTSLAQEFLPDTARIAFVNSDRTAIMAKRIGAPNVDTLIKSSDKVKLSNLAVLASTKDGRSLMVAGTVSFPNPAAPSLTITADILARVDTPYTMSDKITFAADKVTIKAIGSFILLQKYSAPSIDMLKFPLGTISGDENEWYVTWRKTGIGGPLWFYHGKFDGSDMKIDSFQMVSLDGDFHMTNLVTTEDNQSMVVVIVDRKGSSLSRYQSQRWTPRASPPNTIVYTPNDLGGSIRNKVSPIDNLDSAFGFLLHIVNSNTARLGLIKQNRDLANYTFPFDQTSLTLDNQHGMPASAIPSDLRLFVGNTSSPVTQSDGREVYPGAAAPGGGLGNGGDIAYNFDGTSLLFITCGITPDGDYFADSIHSQIWMYHFGDGQAKLVHSDEHAMERQPIFMGTSPRLAPPPPYVPGTATVDQNSLTFPSTKINKTSPMSFSITVPTSSKVIVSDLTIGGTDPAAFTIVPAIATPFDITGHSSKLVTIQFAPTAVQSYSATLNVVYHDSLNQEGNKTLTVSLSGTGEADGAVRLEAEQYFSMNVVPNPLKTSSSVEVTAKENGSVSLEIVNEAGASLYKSASKFIGAGEKANFTVNVSTLGLSDGTYYALLHTAQGDIMRRMIVLK